ncbi:MAG: ABC transporter permease [Myxococcota bacterium]|nr:ABC transporter permease [Myxococcota bacterium]
MAYPSFIGSRYLRSKRRGSISAIGVIAIAGVALGVASLLVVVSITSGFLDEFTKKVLGVNAHVLVMKYGINYTEYRDVMATAETLPEVRGVAPFIYQDMMISKGARTGGVLIKGIDPERVGTVLDLPSHIVKGSLSGLRVPGSRPQSNRSDADRNPAQPDLPSNSPPQDAGLLTPSPTSPQGDNLSQPDQLPGIVLGRSLAENLEADVGDVVQVTTPLVSLDVLGWSPSEDAPRTLKFKVIGLFYAGFLEYDTRLAYIDYYQAQRFFDQGDSVYGVEVTLRDIYAAKRIAKKLKEMLGGGPYHTMDWETLNAHLYTALKMQKFALMFVVVVIVTLAAFNIIATLVMMVFDKRKEIAILKSMGATERGIARIFLHVGTVVGLVGISIGLAFGLGACMFLKKIGWPLDPKVYLIDHLPVRIHWTDFFITAAVAFCICWLATVLPSLSASRLRPVDGIRQD